MSIRIVDQGPDHSTQNPPPEDRLGLGEHSGKCVVVTVSSPDGTTCVLRGSASGGGMENMIFSVHEAPAEPGAPESYRAGGYRNFVEVPALGWKLRASAGTFKVGTGEERTVCKLPPRWQLTALSPQVLAAREQQHSNPGPGATVAGEFR
jgi:hypothetical protein